MTDQEKINIIMKRASIHYPKDGSHGFDYHIKEALEVTRYLSKKGGNFIVTPLLLAVVAYHDASLLQNGKLNHELLSSMIFQYDMRDLFSKEEIEEGMIAIQDHRFSKRKERLEKYGTYWRNRFGEIVSSADCGFPKTTLRAATERSFAYHCEAFPHLTVDEKIQKTFDFMKRRNLNMKFGLPPLYLLIFREEVNVSMQIIDSMTLNELQALYAS
ncbi:MAG: hypothetical protein PHR06_15775 [Candidatus Cloacimonetes bacterium]|nr:hypothetical protein [Candidatus Cloacimonadota bacterium]